MMTPISPSVSVGASVQPKVASTIDGERFARELRARDIELSRHAQERLQSGGVTPAPGDAERLKKGLDKAAEKGSRESLLLLDDKAFIVNVRERLVITGIQRERLKENVFTQIDSAVWI